MFSHVARAIRLVGGTTEKKSGARSSGSRIYIKDIYPYMRFLSLLKDY